MKSLLKYQKRFHTNLHLLPLYKQIQTKLSPTTSQICKITSNPNLSSITLTRKPDSILCKYWWSESPFEKNTKLTLPLFSLENEFQKKTIELENLIFNQPIRRDIIHKLHRCALMWMKKTTHRVKRLNEIHGSGAKPRPQKGSGRARLGNLRAPGRKGGAKAHGPQPKDFTFFIPNKLKLKGISASLSGKLAEGKIIVIDSEKRESLKTKDLKKVLIDTGDKELFLFVTPKFCDKNFILGMRNLKRYKTVNVNDLNILEILKFDKIVFTKKSLEEFTNLYLALSFMYYKPKAVKDKNIEDILNYNFNSEQPDQEKFVFDPNVGFEPTFEILKDYYDRYNKLKLDGKLDDYERPVF